MTGDWRSQPSFQQVSVARRPTTFDLQHQARDSAIRSAHVRGGTEAGEKIGG